jgi:S1-C subfamily serine protease
MRPQLLHLNGPYRGRTLSYAKDVLVFGTDRGCDIRYPDGSAVAGRHAELEYVEEGCAFYLRALEGQVFVNRREIREVILEPEDLIEIGIGGPKLRFRIDVSDGKPCKPFRVMLRDAGEVRGAGGLMASGRSLRQDLWRMSSLRTKAGTIAVLAVLVLLAAYVGGWTGTARTADEHRRRQAEGEERHRRELEEIREQIEEFRDQQTELASREQLDELRDDLARRASVVDRIVQRNEALRQVLDVYSRGVCLLYGSYTWKAERDGVLVPMTAPDGTPLELEYVGSGFLVSEAGEVITNRHVAQPWWADPNADLLEQQGLVPEFVQLAAAFPGRPPVAVDTSTIRLSQEDVDVALLRVQVEGGPVLPLYSGEARDLRGSRVILLGYPTGLNSILARLEPALVQEILAGVTDTASLIAGLAARDAIAPVITQGALNEVRERRLVYDAETTSGGSGGPVFGPDGTVIGVNFAITRDFDGSNFGVPIEFARNLITTQATASGN